ncbi:glycoside hydrolase family 13 protein [Clostridium sp.]
MIGSVIYQIFPDRFCKVSETNDTLITKTWGSEVDSDCVMGGNIEGIINKLDYIRNLGVNIIYFNPIFQSPSNHKYDTMDYYKIDVSLGTLEDFERLIYECHNVGIKIIIDGVFNHTSPEFFAFKDILINQEKSIYINWYEIFNFPVVVKDNPPYRACGGAAFLPKLNTQNAEVQVYIIDVIKYWESKGIDGIRLDVPFEIHSSLLEKIRKSTNLYLVGEVWGYGGEFVPKYFNGVTNYLLRDSVIKAVVNQCITAKMFVDEWKTIEHIYKDNINSLINLAGSHDTKRIYSLCDGNVKKEKIFYTFLFILPGIPLVYYGDEIGLKGENDPYCRGCMEWNELNWNSEIYEFIKELILMRKKHDLLVNGRVKFTCFNDRTLIITRYDETRRIDIIINFGFQQENINGVIVEAMNFKFNFY